MSTSAHNKRIVIIAGPNGAGKTTFARGYKKYRSRIVFESALT